MVGFRDLVGTDIAPVSKKTAVKGETMSKSQIEESCIYTVST